MKFLSDCGCCSSNQKTIPNQAEPVNGKNAPLYTQINQIFMIHCFTVNTLNPQTHIVFGFTVFPSSSSLANTGRDFASSKQCYHYLVLSFFFSLHICSRNNHDFIAYFFSLLSYVQQKMK